MLQSTGMQRVRDDLATEQQSNTEQWEICLRFKYLFWASVATTMNTYLFGTLLMDCNHVFMTIGNNMYDENLHKLKKRNILNTILIVQVVLLGLYSLVLQRYWNTPSETNEKCKFYIIHCQLLTLALVCVCLISCSVMSDSLQSPGLQPTRLLCLWHFPVKNWSALPSPTSWNLPNPGIEPTSLVSPVLASGFFALCHLGSPLALQFSWISSWYILSDTQLAWNKISKLVYNSGI